MKIFIIYTKDRKVIKVRADKFELMTTEGQFWFYIKDHLVGMAVCQNVALVVD